jgi:hypothetical protein
MTEFKEFDNLLDTICPNISYKKYKEVYARVLVINNETEKDYYGGSVSYARYCCDISELYKALVELSVIGDCDGGKPNERNNCTNNSC